ncbi:hypothetical protein [Dulcicalothrix desertica]|nr:hypothetical protein [Dulcicalothrix desertica]
MNAIQLMAPVINVNTGANIILITVVHKSKNWRRCLYRSYDKLIISSNT